MLKDGQPLVLAVDDSMMGKTGRRIPGAGWQRDALSPPFHTNLKYGLKFVQISAAVGPKGRGEYARMIPIAMKVMAKIPKLAKTASPQEQAEHEKRRRQNSSSAHTVALLNKIRSHLSNPDRMIYLVGDGGFTTSTLLRQLPRKTVYIGRTRNDACLCEVPQRKPGRGRPLAYGPRLPTPAELKSDHCVAWSTLKINKNNQSIKIRYKHLPRLRSRTAGEKQIGQVVVIAGFKYKKTKRAPSSYTLPAYLYCSRAHVSVKRLVECYLLRWDIEVNFKEQRQIFGMHHAQVRHPKSVQAAPSLAVSSYSALHLAAIKAYGLGALPPLVSLPKWRRAKPPKRFSTLDLLRQLKMEAMVELTNLSHFDACTPSRRSPRNSFGDHATSPRAP